MNIRGRERGLYLHRYAGEARYASAWSSMDGRLLTWMVYGRRSQIWKAIKGRNYYFRAPISSIEIEHAKHDLVDCFAHDRDLPSSWIDKNELLTLSLEKSIEEADMIATMRACQIRDSVAGDIALARLQKIAERYVNLFEYD